MEKMMVQILQMKNMIVREEARRQKAKKDKEQIVIKVNELKQEMFKTKSKLNDLAKKNKELDSTYVNNTLE
jgi:methylmalonyl-CoA mutase N-terminal domain/subunit